MDSETERNREVSKTLRVNRRGPYYKAAAVVIVILAIVVFIWYISS
jgi:hypothetical protein